MRWNAGRILIAVGIALPLLVMGVSAAAHTSGPTPEGDILVGVQGPGADGQVARVGPNGVEWRQTSAVSYHGVVRDEGRIYAAYANDSRTGYQVLRPGGGIVEKWSYPIQTATNSEVHDIEPLPDGGVVIAGMDRERIFIRRGGERVWQWNASSYYEAPANPRETDWLHINDVDRIGEWRFLVSVRNTHQLLIIERGEGVVEVINEDRDTSLLDAQHNPQWLGDGRVLVADSSNDRVVELAKRDGEWEIVWAVGSAGGQRLSWPRDADRLANGDTLITDSRNNRVVRVDRDGDLVAEWSTPALPYEADRVGEQETPGGPHLSNDVTVPARGEGHFPLLGIGYVALVHGVGVPAWFQQFHVGVLGVGVLLVTFGIGDRLGAWAAAHWVGRRGEQATQRAD